MADKKNKPIINLPLTILNVEVPYVPIFSGLFVALVYWWGSTFPALLNETLLWIIFILPFVIPPLLLALWWIKWRIYVRSYFIAKQKPILLEFALPAHIFKTPKAMEEVFRNLGAVGPGESTFIARWIHGKVRPWWSFEIVSIEGEIHMYVWTWRQFRALLESIFYAQYPNVEINEVHDYTSGIVHDKEKMTGFAVEWKLKNPDIIPIRSYIDMDLDKEMRKPDQIVDPIASVFEKLSTFGSGEQFWVQIMIRVNKGPRKRPVFWFEKPKTWKDEAGEKIKEIYDSAKPKKPEGGEVDPEGYPMLKPAEINLIKALERSIEKPAFDVGMRGVYIAKKESFDGTKIASFLSLWSGFSSGQMNSFIPDGPWHITFDYPWQDWRGEKSHKATADAIDAFRRRSFFHPPHERIPFVLTSEELATIYHFPGEEVRAPGLRRIASTKSEPPSNLPV